MLIHEHAAAAIFAATLFSTPSCLLLSPILRLMLSAEMPRLHFFDALPPRHFVENIRYSDAALALRHAYAADATMIYKESRRER